MDKNLSSENWYFNTPEGLKGPFSLTSIRGFVLSGQIRLEDEIYNKEENFYQKAHEIFPDLIDSIGDGSFRPPPKPAVLDAQQSQEPTTRGNDYLQLFGKEAQKKQRLEKKAPEEKQKDTLPVASKMKLSNFLHIPIWAQGLFLLGILGGVAAKYVMQSHEDSPRSPATALSPAAKPNLRPSTSPEVRKPPSESHNNSALGTGNNSISTSSMGSSFGTSQPQRAPVNPPPGMISNANRAKEKEDASRETTPIITESPAEMGGAEGMDPAAAQYYDVNAFDPKNANKLMEGADSTVDEGEVPKVAPEVEPSQNQLNPDGTPIN